MDPCPQTWTDFAADLAAAHAVVAARCRRLGDDGDDLAQEAALAALEAFRAGSPAPDSLVAWMTTIAARRRVDCARSRARSAQAGARVYARLLADERSSDFADEVANRDEARLRVRRLETLPASTRAVVAAVVRSGSRQRAARDLRLTYRSVEAHLRRARQRLLQP